jgi:Fe-S-cluster containining protein
MEGQVIGLTVDGWRFELDDGPPRRLADLARLAMDVCRRLTDRAAARSAAAGAAVSCRKGCAACCRHPVQLSLPETWMVAETVEALPAARRAETLRRFAGAREALGAAGLLGLPLLANGKAIFQAWISCPFLVAEACTIHRERPAVCREHLAVGPAARCGAWEGGALLVPIPVRMGDCLAETAARLLDSAPTYLPLVRALEWTRANPAQGRRTWPGREIVGTFAEVLHGLRAGDPPARSAQRRAASRCASAPESPGTRPAPTGTRTLESSS